MADLHFGVTLPQIKRPWEDTRAAALEIEAVGFDSVWFNDHLYASRCRTCRSSRRGRR